MSHDIPLQHVHNFEQPYPLNCHALEHSQYMKTIATCNTKDIKRFKKEVLNSEVERYKDILNQGSFYIHKLQTSLNQHHSYVYYT